MPNKKREHIKERVEYYAPNRELITSFARTICHKLGEVEGTDRYPNDICDDFVDFVEIVTAISVARANRDSDQSLDNAAAEE